MDEPGAGAECREKGAEHCRKEKRETTEERKKRRHEKKQGKGAGAVVFLLRLEPVLVLPGDLAYQDGRNKKR